MLPSFLVSLGAAGRGVEREPVASTSLADGGSTTIAMTSLYCEAFVGVGDDEGPRGSTSRGPVALGVAAIFAMTVG